MQYYDVFVYGTLRKGGTNHHYLENTPCLRDAIWLPGFRIYDFQHQYPFMLASPGPEQVKGEIYRVNEAQLQLLNILEDIQNELYKLVYLQAPQCYTYLKFDSEVSNMALIQSGDWIKYISEVSN